MQQTVLDAIATNFQLIDPAVEEAVERCIHKSDVLREELFITTKPRIQSDGHEEP